MDDHLTIQTLEIVHVRQNCTSGYVAELKDDIDGVYWEAKGNPVIEKS
jgi:hypothetical protein